MGASQSRINKASENLQALHKNVDSLYDQIEREANRLEKDITGDNFAGIDFTKKDQLCDRLTYHYVDQLEKLFPVETIEGVAERLQLGIVPKPETEIMVNHKRGRCEAIVSFYKQKLQLLDETKKELLKCKEMEKKIYNDLSGKLRSLEIKSRKWMDVYRDLDKFNKAIIYQYSQTNRILEDIRSVKTQKDLNDVSARVRNYLKRTVGICANYEQDLLKFSDDVLARGTEEGSGETERTPKGKEEVGSSVGPSSNGPAMNQPPMNRPSTGIVTGTVEK